jgi:hypothetical protein
MGKHPKHEDSDNDNDEYDDEEIQPEKIIKRLSSTRGGGNTAEPLLEIDMWATKGKAAIKA